MSYLSGSVVVVCGYTFYKVCLLYSYRNLKMKCALLDTGSTKRFVIRSSSVCVPYII